MARLVPYRLDSPRHLAVAPTGHVLTHVLPRTSAWLLDAVPEGTLVWAWPEPLEGWRSMRVW